MEKSGGMIPPRPATPAKRGIRPHAGAWGRAPGVDGDWPRVPRGRRRNAIRAAQRRGGVGSWLPTLFGGFLYSLERELV